MILIAYNPEYVKQEDVADLIKSLEFISTESVYVIAHFKRDVMPIYISDGRIIGVRIEANLSNNNET